MCTESNIDGTVDANMIVFCVDGSLEMSLFIVSCISSSVGIDRRERCDLTSFEVMVIIMAVQYKRQTYVPPIVYVVALKNEKHTGYITYTRSQKYVTGSLLY